MFPKAKHTSTRDATSPRAMCRQICFLLIFWIMGVRSQDLPRFASSYADPLQDIPMTSQDYVESFMFPEPANPNTRLVNPFPPPDQPQDMPPAAPTQAQFAFPVQPTKRHVVLPVQSTSHTVTRRTTVRPATTLSPNISPDHYVRLTMRVVNPLRVNEGPTSYRCYLSQPDVGRSSLSTGRYSQTSDGGTSGAAPPPPAGQRLGGHGMVVDLSSSGYGGFGTFYCQAFQDKKDTTTVVGIFLSPDPKIIPAGRRFTKTASLGDLDVTIAMTIRSPADALTNQIQWRKDGGVIMRSLQGLAAFMFRRPIRKADSGVYECYYANERNQARHGLIRLIVRECPAGKWHPPRCTGVCDACFNGGVCDHVTGKCICPPGFTGTNCEQACGFNRFGVSCEHRCSPSPDDPYSCRGSQFCLPDPFGCTCNAGFKGLECYTDCDAGYYGAGCLQTCHCASGQCDRFTGVCLGSPSGCSRGWSGVNCQVPDICPRGYFGSDCLSKCHCANDEACDKVNGRCPQNQCAPGFAVYDGDVYCSECHPGTFGVACAKTCPCIAESCDRETGECDGGCFQQYLMPTCQAGISGITTTRVNTGQSEPFNCTITSSSNPNSLPAPSNVLLYRISGGVNQVGVSRLGSVSTTGSLTVMYGVDGVREDENLRCVVVGADGTILARREVSSDTFALPIMPRPPTVTDQTAFSVSLRWQPWSSGGSDRVGDAPVVAYLVLYRQNGTSAWIRGQRVSGVRIAATQRGLQPHTWYEFSVAAIREGMGGEGPPSPWTTVRTLCQVPTRPRAVVASTDVKFPKQISLAWHSPDQTMIRCPSGLVGFNIYYREIDSVYSETGTLRLFNPTVTNHEVTGLHIYTKYLFSMSLLNEAGEGERSEEVMMYSPEEIPPPPVHLNARRSSTGGVLVSWENQSPSNLNGKIRYYELHYETSQDHENDVSDSQTIHIDHVLSETKYRIATMKANSTYNLKVRIVNGVGPSEWSESVMVSTFDAPAAIMAHGDSSIHGPKIGLSIMGVFVGLLLLAGVFVGAVWFRRKRRVQKQDELATLRNTVAFSRPTVKPSKVNALKGKAIIKQEDLYMTTIEIAKQKKKAKQRQKQTTSSKNKEQDEHRYEYIEPLRFPVMRFALLANEDETVIHSYPVMDT